MPSLPIEPLLPEIVATLERSARLVLRAPPGAGKTTRVPAALLDAGLAGGKQVVVLEPRRIAARAAAGWVAEARGGEVGGEVGYRVRFEQRGGTATKLWFVTEGVFSRQLVRDPFLEDVGVVVLDEFHERHLQGDVALGVVRELQESVRPDLRLVVMSATLETARLAAFLGDSSVLTSEGRAFPVTIEYASSDSSDPLAPRVARAVRRALETGPGDVLVFLPGAAAIRRVGEALAPLAEAIDVVPLHGNLPLEEQRRAILAGPRRKVVLATNVAETALTIEGVRTVVDSGFAREALFEPRRGIDRLREAPISRAAADQRAGRAGRTGPGLCIRLWSEANHAARKERETPEVLRLDLATTVLELRAWGARDARSFPWLDPPAEAAMAVAERLLLLLGALDSAGGVTVIGRRMLELSVPPRLARMLVEGERSGASRDVAVLAALASEHDVLAERRALRRAAAPARPSGPSDLLLRLELFREVERRGFDRNACRMLGLDPGAVRAVDRAWRQLARGLPARGDANRSDDAALLRAILAGFPDRVARRRGPGSPRAVMVGGSGVVLDPASVVRDDELFVAVDLEAGPGDARVTLASAVRREWLEVRERREIVFDESAGRVVERVRQLHVDLVLAETLRHDVDPVRAGEILSAVVARDPAAAIDLRDEDRALLERLRFLARALPELGLPAEPDAILARAAETLAAGKRSVADVRRADVGKALRSLLGRDQLRALERDAPERFPLPSGRMAPIRYDRDAPPVVAGRIQELFGLRATPRIAQGTVPLVVEALAPNGRPVQRTDDLESFWRRTYPEVRKQLRGRYPKHAWPEDPLAAAPRIHRSRGSG